MKKDKYFVFIISAGRTGTRFFGKTLERIINNCYSIHEPDVLIPREGYDLMKKLKTFGLYHLAIGKILGKTGIRNLSQNYLAGNLTVENLEKALIKQRYNYYEKIQEQLIIESYSGWYGCIPAIQNLYKNYKIIIITRNPKDWITSNMDCETLFGKKDWVNKLKLGRLNPKMINDKEYLAQWKNFSRFEKICWTYKTQYETMLRNTQNDPNAKIIKFEDLFYSDNKYETLRELLSFISNFQDKKFNFSIPDQILSIKIHGNTTNKFPDYSQWNNKQKDDYEKICSSITKKLNY